MSKSLRSVQIVIFSISLGLVSFVFWPLSSVTAQSAGISSIAWSPDGTKLASGSFDRTVKIWDATTGNVLLTLVGHTSEVDTIAWSPDGSKVVSGSNDKTARIWNAATGALLGTLTGHEDGVYAVSWSPDGSKVITGSVEEHQNLRIWNATTGQLIHSESIGSIVQIVWSPNGSQFATANPGGAATLQDATTFGMVAELPQPEPVGEGYDIYTVAWKPDNSQIATGSLNNVVRIWDVGTRQILNTFAGNDSSDVDHNITTIRDLKFVQGGQTLISISADGTIRSWAVATGQMISTTKLSTPVSAAAWSPDGTKLAYGTSSGSIQSVAAPGTLEFQHHPDPDGGNVKVSVEVERSRIMYGFCC